MESLIEIKKELQSEFRTHIQVVSTSNFTHYSLIGIGKDGLARPARNAVITIIRNLKVERLSKKALLAHHQMGIEEAREKYKDLI